MYLYFDNKGTLLETINDEALRQYNKGVNTVNVFIEDAENPDSGMIPWNIGALKYWFQLVDGDVLQKVDYELKRDKTAFKSVPFDRNRDLKYFQYGKVYEFFVIEVPCGEISELSKSDDTIEFVTDNDVFRRGGLVLMTMQAGKIATKDDTTISRWLSLERVSFTVEDAVLLPDSAVNSSEFNWLLQQYIIGDYLRPQLVYGVIDDIATDDYIVAEANVSVILKLSVFNREPKIGEKFLYIYRKDNIVYAVMATVVEINDDANTAEAMFGKDAVVQLTGPQGIQGIQGLQGPRGFYFTPSVSKNGDISWTNDGGLENPATVNVQGPVFTPSVSDAGIISWTNNGDLPNPPQKNINGRSVYTGKYTEAIVGSAITSVHDVSSDSRVGDLVIAICERTRISGYDYIVSQFMIGRIVSKTDDTTCECSPFSTVILTGPQGPQGIQGIQGEQGQTGPQGVIFTPYVSASGVLSWANDGGLPNPASVNITGPQGRQGEQGEAGSDGLMCTGTVLSYYAPQASYLMVSNFNRTPKVGESFLLLWNTRDSSSNAIVNTYMCIATVSKIENNRVDFTVPTSYSIMGGTGATGAKGDTGAGITSASVQEVTITEQYTTTPITFSLSDGSVIGPVNIQAKNGTTPNCIAYVGTVEASAWISSSTYASYGYGYQAKIPKYDQSDLVYAFETYIPEVIPVDVADIMGTNFAPFAETRTDGLIIYAKEKPTTAKTFNITLTHTNSNS